MCGRFVITASGNVVADVFNLDAAPELPKRYNIAPSQPIFAVRRGLKGYHDGLEADWFSWGLVPGWADNPNIAFKTFNARAETARKLPTFRDAFKYRRCVIPVSGYYEWKEIGGGKPTPHFISRADGGLMLMAGLWEHWMDPGGSEIYSATILTRNSRNIPSVSEVHHRMPVLLERSDFPCWYGNTPPTPTEFKEIANRVCQEMFQVWPVGHEVNQVKLDNAGLIKRVAVLEQGELF